MTDPPRVVGHYCLFDPDGATLESSDASFEPLTEALTVHPKLQAPLRVDFAEVDSFALGDHLALLTLATGEKIEISMLGQRHGEIASLIGERLGAYQARHLLLEEAVGGESFPCGVRRPEAVEDEPATVRVFATSIAVLPRLGVPFSLPLGEVTQIGFDEECYRIELAFSADSSGGLALVKLGKQTKPCLRLLEERLTSLRRRTADALAFLAPALTSLQARRLAQAMPDGVPARRSQIDSIAPGLFQTLLEAAAGSAALRKTCAALEAMGPPGEACVGIKETNSRQDDEAEPGMPEATGGGESDDPDSPEERLDGGQMVGRVVWFAFPIVSEDRGRPGNAIAFEAATRAGRATYLFRVASPETYRTATWDEILTLARERVRSVSRAMTMLTFKREPIYLPEEKMRAGAFARYRLAMRLSAPLKAARATFVARAIHTSTWATQLASALEHRTG